MNDDIDLAFKDLDDVTPSPGEQAVGEGLDRHRDADLAGIGAPDQQLRQDHQPAQAGAVPRHRSDPGKGMPVHSIITVRWMLQ